MKINANERLMAADSKEAEAISKVFKKIIPGKFSIEESMGEIIVKVKKGVAPCFVKNTLMLLIRSVGDSDFEMHVDSIKNQLVFTFDVEKGE